MVKLKRSADFVATLVYADEPQVVHLRSKTVPVVAVAIPSKDDSQALFLATTASQKDWDSYLEGSADLRYLFIYPKTRLLYTFDFHKVKNKSITMDPFDAVPPDDFLPPPRFFSTSHTEDFDLISEAGSTEQLLVDGEWQLQEFGRFYQRYSDIYAFVVAQMNWAAKDVAGPIKTKIREAFAGRPFRGGSSYLHLFNDLFDGLPRDERLGLDKVKYASPGFVDVNGRADAFAEVNTSVRAFLLHRVELREKYSNLHAYLSKLGYLTLPGDMYAGNDGTEAYINKQARQLADDMPPLDYDTILELSKSNALVAAKVTLSFYRRLEEASGYFAQGRVSFDA